MRVALWVRPALTSSAAVVISSSSPSSSYSSLSRSSSFLFRSPQQQRSTTGATSWTTTRRTTAIIGWSGVAASSLLLFSGAASGGSVTYRPQFMPSSYYSTSTQCGATTTSDSSRESATGAETTTTTMDTTMGYLNAADAAALDQELMTLPGFTLEQLMELAGLAVAQAVYLVLNDNNNQKKDEPITSSTDSSSSSMLAPEKKILIICGPGNNGGDGLVAARHLVMFGYNAVTVVYPQPSGHKQPHYNNLVQQCLDLHIPVLDTMPDDYSTGYVAIVDAIFGFSFRGGQPRPPFDAIMDQLISLNDSDNVTTFAVDIPSGWDVDGAESNIGSDKFHPNVLISLTVPKLCAQQFTTGRHFVGGRFLPPKLAQKYNIRMPPYPGVSQVMEVTASTSRHTESRESGSAAVNEDNWEAAYADYLAEKAMSETTTAAAEAKSQQQTTLSSSGETWEEQYAAYCAEKEAAINELERQQKHRDASDC